MKKGIVLIVTLIMVLCTMAACGQSSSGGSGSGSAETAAAFDPAQFKTLADVFAYVGENSLQEGYTETHYVTVFAVDDVNYRVIADIPEDVSKEIWAIDFEDEDRDQKVTDLLSPLEVKVCENLSEQIPSQEELDKYVGKTGQELFDEGWSDYSYYNLEDMDAGLNFGPFTYTVKFEYDGEPMVNTDDFDFFEEFKDLKVSSVVYEGLGDATNVE